MNEEQLTSENMTVSKSEIADLTLATNKKTSESLVVYTTINFKILILVKVRVNWLTDRIIEN